MFTAILSHWVSMGNTFSVLGTFIQLSHANGQSLSIPLQRQCLCQPGGKTRVRSPGQFVKCTDSLAPAQSPWIRLGGWEGKVDMLILHSFHWWLWYRQMWNTTAFSLERLVHFSNFLKRFNPLMAKMHISSIISTVDRGRFSYTSLPNPHLLYCSWYIMYRKIQKEKKTNTTNYSVCQWHLLTKKMSSQIWFLLVIVQTYVEAPHPPLAWLSCRLIPQLLSPLACDLKLSFQTQPFCSYFRPKSHRHGEMWIASLL